MAFSLRMEAQEPEGDSRLRTLIGSLGDRRVAAGMWLTTLPGVLFGTLAVLGPLRMDELGAGAAAIAGRLPRRRRAGGGDRAADRPPLGPPRPARAERDRRRGRRPDDARCSRGRARPAGLGVLIVFAGPLIGMLYTPAMAMLSDGADHAGVSQGFAFALVNLAWATGQTAGAAGSARLADATDDRVPYLVLAGGLRAHADRTGPPARRTP